ncbi:MAG: GyrI-like domain-containing protein [Gammaproteobacteria bacterium]|nr:GyrI-like domain-containing protein [Gammaproteobacteria bacterium]
MKTPELVSVDAKKVAGITCRTDNFIEMSDDDDGGRIAKLWQQFFAEQVMNQIPHCLDQGPLYGVYYDFASDVNGKYTVLAGMETAQAASTEMVEPFSLIEIKAGNYLRFSAQGEMPATCIELWKTLWHYFDSSETPYQRQYGSDFECYSAQDQIDIYIAVTEKSQ